MKKIIFIIFSGVLMLLAVNAKAQSFDNSLNEARSAYQGGDLESTRFALQQAMNELDQAIGQEILKLLPARMGNMQVKEEDEVVSAAAVAFVGLHVSRRWEDGEKNAASLQLIADSPLLTGINAILALPMIGSDPNQKRVRIAGYRGLLQKDQRENGETYWDLSLPIGSSLLTMNFQGISDERAVMDMANSLPLEQIARMLQ